MLKWIKQKKIAELNWQEYNDISRMFEVHTYTYIGLLGGKYFSVFCVIIELIHFNILMAYFSFYSADYKR